MSGEMSRCHDSTSRHSSQSSCRGLWWLVWLPLYSQKAQVWIIAGFFWFSAFSHISKTCTISWLFSVNCFWAMSLYGTAMNCPGWPRLCPEMAELGSSYPCNTQQENEEKKMIRWIKIYIIVDETSDNITDPQ